MIYLLLQIEMAHFIPRGFCSSIPGRHLLTSNGSITPRKKTLVQDSCDHCQETNHVSLRSQMHFKISCRTFNFRASPRDFLNSTLHIFIWLATP